MGFSVLAEDDFFVKGEDDTQISQLLGMTKTEFDNYCNQNNVTYFAVNKDNTKQIKRSEYSDEFSNKVVDLSALEDDKILELAPSLSGFEEARGEVVKHNNLKFLKVEMSTSDGGGEYVLTQYVTVKQARKIVLVFYSDADFSREYITSVFQNQFPKEKNYKPYVIIGIIVFAFASAVTSAFIIRDVRKKDE